MWANLWPSSRAVISTVVVGTAEAPFRTWRRFVANRRLCYGWPMTVMEENAGDSCASNWSATDETTRECIAGRGEPDLGAQAATVTELARCLYPTNPALADDTVAPPQYFCVAVNLLVALAFLAAVAFWLEGRISRRERQQAQAGLIRGPESH
ncbi:MAG: hypothetical protein ABSE73_20250 [Planctomycetota bacterium]